MKQYFSFSLFKDAMKQLRVHGFVFLIVVCFPVFFGGMFLGENQSNIPISYLAILSYSVIAPIMTFYLFGFLNKRNSSDFYHGIPKSRTCIYITYISAIMTWITIILTTSTVLSFIMCQLQKRTKNFHKINVYRDLDWTMQYEIAYKETFIFLIGLLVSSLLVITAIIIGMSLSGTLFTGFTITGMILFLPSILLLFITAHISRFAPYISTEHFFFLFDSEPDNLVAASFATFFDIGNWNITDLFLNKTKIIYTLVIAILYGIIGDVLFNKRHSECAGFSSIYPKVQTSIRCLCGITFSLIPLSLIFNERTKYYSTNLTEIIMLYLIAIIIYFMFELISTKHVKNLVKSIPGVLLIAISNILLYGIIIVVCIIGAKFQPDADEIEYVMIRFDLEQLNNIYANEYLYKLASEYKIEDEVIKTFISDSLKDTVEHYSSPDDTDSYDSYYTGYCFGICVDGKVTYRNLHLNLTNKGRLTNYLKNKTTIFEQFFDIPKPSKSDLQLSNVHKSVCSADELMDIYNCFMEELDTLPKARKENNLLRPPYLYNMDMPVKYNDWINFHLKQTIRYKKDIYTYEFSITPLTPKSYNMALEHLNAYFNKYIAQPDLLKDRDCYMLHIYDTKEDAYHCISYEESNFNRFFEAAKSCSDIPTVDKDLYFIEDMTNNDFIGVLASSNELDVFIDHINED